ncbi:Capsular polysaccharide synthesis [Pelomyxa schiedti]|nr:Capsular polysaccharide synthesis [Pelomyxa schiedti]
MKFNKGVVAAASVVAITVVCIYLASNRTPDAPVDGAVAVCESEEQYPSAVGPAEYNRGRSRNRSAKWSLLQVDPWMWQETYDDAANVAQTAQDALYQKTVGDLRPFKHATVLRLTSEQAAKLIPDDSLSFVYIDARHDYSSVLQDLSLWYPKLKRGGVLAGHDFIDIDEMPEWRVQPDGSVETLRAVKSAVLNFTTRICRQLCVCWDEYKWSSFYFAK